jgi:hypothetical protein
VPRLVEEPAPRRPAYFWWLLANVLALCFAVVSWTFCLELFGNPERPRNYAILKKLGRLPELRRYTVLDVPNGTVRAPQFLYAKFFEPSKNGKGYAIGDADLRQLNELGIRNYLTNFTRPLALTYIEGDYQVRSVRSLGPADFITRGLVVRAQALVKPDDFTQPGPFPVLIDYIFPTRDDASAFFRTGDILEVRKAPNCAAVIHVARVMEDGEALVCLTVVPIAYGPYRAGDEKSFSIEPPAEVNPAAEFPMFKP